MLRVRRSPSVLPMHIRNGTAARAGTYSNLVCVFVHSERKSGPMLCNSNISNQSPSSVNPNIFETHERTKKKHTHEIIMRKGRENSSMYGSDADADVQHHCVAPCASMRWILYYASCCASAIHMYNPDSIVRFRI